MGSALEAAPGVARLVAAISMIEETKSSNRAGNLSLRLIAPTPSSHVDRNRETLNEGERVGKYVHNSRGSSLPETATGATQKRPGKAATRNRIT